jgi:LysM repeat protein
LIVGDAVRVPTVIEIMDYSTIQEHLEKSTAGKKKLTAEDIGKIAKGADKIISSID